MNPLTTLLSETAGYRRADDVLRWASSPGQRIAIAVALLARTPVRGTDWQNGFRLRLDEELLRTPVEC